MTNVEDKLDSASVEGRLKAIQIRLDTLHNVKTSVVRQIEELERKRSLLLLSRQYRKEHHVYRD
jgi:hypothetical protein